METVTVVELDTDDSSALVAVMVYVPAVLGEVHTPPAVMVPPLAVQVIPSVGPSVAVAMKVCVPGAMLWFAGVTAVIWTFRPTVKLVVAVALV